MKYIFRGFLTESTHYSIKRKEKISQARPDHHDYHPHYEIYYCRQAVEQEVIINGQLLTVDKPSVIISSPFSIHGMSKKNATDTEFERFTLYFDDDFLDSFPEGLLPHGLFRKTPNCIYPLDSVTNLLFSILFDHLIEVSGNPSEFTSYFAAMVNTLDRAVAPESRITGGSPNYYVVDVLQYIYDNKSTPCDTDTIATKFHISRAKLDRDFRRFVGQPVHRTVIDCKLEYAILLLTTTTHKVCEIATMCGFESEYYFYSFFKRNTGKTPLEVRRGAKL